MNRELYLNNHWLAYPAFVAHGEWFCGEMVNYDQDSQIQVRLLDKVHAFKLASQSSVMTQWGPSCPPSFLVVGDRVAIHASHGTVLLLAPRLTPLPLVGHSTLWQDRPVVWRQFLRKVEDFFIQRGLTHVPTPSLVICPGVDHHIDPLAVSETRALGRRYLPTSPEIHLKKYLCRGYDQIFEIKTCYRDDWQSPHHSTEFTMLEWYRAYSGLETLMADVEALFEHFEEKPRNIQHWRIPDLFQQYAGLLLTPDTTEQELQSCLRKWELHFDKTDDWNDLFFRIYIAKIEPALVGRDLIFVSHFPATQASLSRVDADGWAQRFEVYCEGVELANAYLEVNDPELNRRIFAKESNLRQTKGHSVSPLDQDFFDHLQSGMPPASGIALGLDRLFQLLYR